MINIKLILILLIFSILIFSLNQLRSSGIGTSSPIEDFLYGNTFSDVRDFALVLSNWNGNYLNGKAYLADLLSFLPTSISEYRFVWNFGRYTVRLAGYDELVHPGFRLGQFGEPFFNFGVLGVVIFGFIGGYLMSFVNYYCFKFSSEGKIAEASAVFLASLLFPYLFISIGFFQFYVFLVILIVFYLYDRCIIGLIMKK